MDKRFWSKIREHHSSYGKACRKLIGESNIVLNNSKRAIFALQRGNKTEGKQLLVSAAKQLAAFGVRFKKEPMLAKEGAYRAAVEEFIEASLFERFLSKKPLGEIKGIPVPGPETYLAGLADVPGELVRYAIGKATQGNLKEAARAHKEAEEIIGFLISLDLTGYLRTKFDQAKNALRRMEEISYDLALKGRR